MDRGGGSGAGLDLSRVNTGHVNLPGVPQPRHRAAVTKCFPWSQGSDCIIRNEGSRVQIPLAPLIVSPISLAH